MGWRVLFSQRERQWNPFDEVGNHVDEGTHVLWVGIPPQHFKLHLTNLGTDRVTFKSYLYIMTKNQLVN